MRNAIFVIGIWAVLLLPACSSLGLSPIGQPTLAGLAKYTPPTAAVLGPACGIPDPTPDDSNACDLFKINVMVCHANLEAVGEKVNGVLMLVPQYGPVAATVNAAAIEPAIGAAQLWYCNANGYLQPAKEATK